MNTFRNNRKQKGALSKIAAKPLKGLIKEAADLVMQYAVNVKDWNLLREMLLDEVETEQEKISIAHYIDSSGLITRVLGVDPINENIIIKEPGETAAVSSILKSNFL